MLELPTAMDRKARESCGERERRYTVLRERLGGRRLHFTHAERRQATEGGGAGREML